MTVAVQPVQKDNTDAQLLMNAIQVATNLYGVRMNAKQQETLKKYEIDKKTEEDTKKAAAEQAKNAQEFDKTHIALPSGQENTPGAQVLTRPGESQPKAYISLELLKQRMANDNDLKKAQIAAASKERSAEDKKATEAEKNTALFGQRMEQANTILTGLEDNQAFDIAGLGNSIQRSSLFPEYFKNEDLKKYEQAQRNFVNAVLRKESGASIGKDEFSNAVAQYFPQPGDTKEVIDQKRENRLLAIESFKNGAGREWDKINVAATKPAQQTQGAGEAFAATPKVDSQIDQYSKAHNLTYQQARTILMNRGYKPNE